MSDMTDPFSQLHLLREVRKERREDLDEVARANEGANATNIMLLQQARLGARLTDADSNAPVDVTEDVPAGESTGEEPESPATQE